MATQPAHHLHHQSNHNRLHHATRRKLLRQAQDFYDHILAFYDLSPEVKDVQRLKEHVDKFLALPPSILAEWEQLPDEVIDKIKAELGDNL